MNAFLYRCIRLLNLEHPPGIEPRTSAWKAVVLPTKLWMRWCPLMESNHRLRITKPLLYHLTKEAALTVVIRHSSGISSMGKQQYNHNTNTHELFLEESNV